MSFIYTIVKNIVVYLVLITILMNLLGKTSYRKYVNVFTGMLLILLVVTPILSLFGKEADLDYFLKKNQYTTESKSFQSELSVMEVKGQNKLIEQYKSEILNQIEVMVKNQKLNLIKGIITVDEDVNSPTCGEIRHITLTVSLYEKETLEENVENVQIDNIEITAKKDELYQQIDNYEKQKDKNITVVTQNSIDKLTEKISEFYCLTTDMIDIEITE